MPASVWAVLLLVVAIGIVALEMFIPSGGILGIMAAASMLASVVVVFKYYGMAWGSGYLIFNAMLAPVVIMAALRWWPYTPIGRKMLNLPPGEEAAITSTPSYDEFHQLVGKTGVAESKMLPSGTIKIGDRRYDAVGQGMAIDPGEPIVVVSVEGNRINVRPISITGGSETPSNSASTGEVGDASEQASTLDQVIPDPFDD